MSAPTAPDASYHYVITAQKPTNVTHSLTGHFTSATATNLIVAKSTLLEVHTIGPEGLQPVFETAVYGRISCLRLFRPPGRDRDLLFLSTERYQFCILEYQPESGVLQTNATGNLRDDIGRPTEIGHQCVVGPDAQFIALYLYEGVLKVLPLKDGALAGEPFDLLLDEAMVLHLQCLHGTTKPTLAVLFQDAVNARHVKTYEVDVDVQSLTAGPWGEIDVEGGASFVIPIPEPAGGMVVAGRESVTYFKDTEAKGIPVSPMEVKAYEAVDASGDRFLLGDQAGGLHAMVLVKSVDDKAVEELTIQRVGTTSPASSLRYLDRGFVFVGSCYGDSQLVKLHDTVQPELGSCVEVLESYTNLGPILDFCVMDLDRQGQGQIVTCSGSGNDGTLRIVRNGIGIEEQAVIELPGITGIWSLRPASAAAHHKYLVQAYHAETRVFGIDGEEMEEIEIAGFDDSTQSLFCGNMLGDHLVQVTRSEVRLVACSDLSLVHTWKPDGGARITVAAGNASQVLVALTGGKVVYLELDAEAKPARFGAPTTATMPHEVSCLSVTPLVTSDPEGDVPVEGDVPAVPTRSSFAAVGLWTDITVRVLSLPSLDELTQQSLGGDIQARSVMMATLEGEHYLFAALGDGHLFNFVVDATSGALSRRKKVSLGTQPIQLSSFWSKGSLNVFAACDRPTVLYSASKKLMYSNVNLPEVAVMAPFHSESFPDCLALASDSALTIGTVDDIQKLHIRTVPLGEQPHFVCHHPSSASLVVCTTAVTAGAAGAADNPATYDAAVDEENGFVRLVDDTTFEVLSSYDLDAKEKPLAITTANFTGLDQEVVIVATAYVKEGEDEPSSGRVIVLSVASSSGEDGDGAAPAERRLVELVTWTADKGGVFSLHPFQGMLLAGINSNVQLLKWGPPVGSSDAADDKAGGDAGAADDAGAGAGAGAGAAAGTDDPAAPNQLSPVCSFRGSVLSLYLDSRGDFITVGDLMTSVSLLRYETDEHKLELLANHPSAYWCTSVSMLSDDVYLAAEQACNLYVLGRHTSAESDEERVRLDVVAQFHLGEFVNCFRRGSLVMQPADMADAAAAAPADVGAAAGAGAGAGAAAAAAAAPDATPASVVSAVSKTKVLYGSINGAIGVVATLQKPLFQYLARVQRAIASVVRGVGGFSHADWRSWFNERMVPVAPIAADQDAHAASGFIDGDLVRVFLDLPPDKMLAVVKAVNEDGEGTETAGPTGPFAGPVTVEGLTQVLEDVNATLV